MPEIGRVVIGRGCRAPCGQRDCLANLYRREPRGTSQRSGASPDSAPRSAPSSLQQLLGPLDDLQHGGIEVVGDAVCQAPRRFCAGSAKTDFGRKLMMSFLNVRFVRARRASIVVVTMQDQREDQPARMVGVVNRVCIEPQAKLRWRGRPLSEAGRPGEHRIGQAECAEAVLDLRGDFVVDGCSVKSGRDVGISGNLNPSSETSKRTILEWEGCRPRRRRVQDEKHRNQCTCKPSDARRDVVH